ncbi:MAG: prepilin-type N-terminal cleavage/methylation domain-containing protein [Proteobacteria bacterium]|nr:prepilin-type N-terminal cleavage/methylation domain-containing protein [Pseudomonadota bacterium]
MRRSRAGFTLVEIMIALTILAFGLLTVAAAQLHAMRGARSGKHTSQALAIAQSQMEQLQRMRWTSLAPTGWTPGVVVSKTVEGPVNQVEQTYTVQWRITNLIPNTSRAVDVRVAWVEPNRPNRSYTVSSARYNHEGL